MGKYSSNLCSSSVDYCYRTGYSLKFSDFVFDKSLLTIQVIYKKKRKDTETNQTDMQYNSIETNANLFNETQNWVVK